MYTSLVLSTLLFFGAFVETAYAQAGLPAGCHTATTAEVNAGAPAGRPVCPNDTRAGITNDAGTAKQYLKTLTQGSVNIDQLNNSFAMCAANFFKAFTQRYGGVRITSAYRSKEHEIRICRNNPGCGAQMNNPNPTSNHQRGVAMDVWSTADQSLMWNFATQNPQFGVCFPFQNGDLSRFKDRPHMILGGIGGGEGGLCARRGVTKACSGSNFDPRSVEAAPAAPQTPTSAVADAARRALNLPSYANSFGLNAAQSQGQNCTLPDGMVVPCSSIANSGGTTPAGQTGSTVGSPPPALPASQQPFSSLQAPTSGMNLVSPQAASPSTGVSTQRDSDRTKLSAIEQIEFLARGEDESRTATGTSTPFILTITAKDAKTLAQSPLHTPPPPGTTVNAETSGVVQQTFTSPDLGYGYQSAPPPSESALQSLLAQFREILIKALQLLRPFGRIYGPEDEVTE